MGPGRQVIPFPERVVGAAFETAFVPSKRKKAISQFNKAVKKGMKIVKASTSYGKKGVINAPKKAFKAVVSAASAVNKGKKMPKSGLKRKLMMVMRKLR